MATGADERLVVMLEARLTDFERNMRKAANTGTRTYTGLQRGSRSATRQMEADMARSSTRINQALASTSAQVGSFAKSFAIGFAGGAIAAAFAGITTNASQAVNAIAQIGDEAKRAGLASDAFQEWKYVAEQNRIGLDALVDGFKELNLRADEFVVTGGGSAAEAFKRLGFGATDLTKKLEDPNALMMEIIGRMEGLDKAAQIRIADELFGGTGGEQFVQLLDKGQAGIQGQIERARELGLVIDKDMIAKAAELDAKFSEVSSRMRTIWQTGVIEAGYFFGLIEREREKLKLVPEEAAQVIGDELAAQLAALPEVAQEVLQEVESLRTEYIQLGEASDVLAGQLSEGSNMLRGLGKEAEAVVLTELAQELADAAAEFERGEITGKAYAQKLGDVATSADIAINAMDELDRARLTGIVGAVANLVDWIGQIPKAVAEAKVAVSSGALMDTGTALTGSGADLLPPSSLAPATSPRPQPPGVDSLGDWEATQSSAGGGGGGGRSSAAYDEAIAAMEREIAVLAIETAAFLDAADARGNYAGMADFAKKKAELLIAAQEQGLTITPELTAAIDAQAQAFVRAGQEAEAAADRVEQVQAASEKGRDALGSVFDAIVEGGDAAKKAIIELLIEMAKVQFKKTMFGAIDGVGGGSLLTGLGNLLSFDGGGSTGNGPRAGGLDGKGGFLAIMHPRETVTDHTKGQSASAQRQSVDVRVSIDQNGNLQAFVDQRAGQISQAVSNQAAARMGAAINKALPARIAEIQKNPRRG